MTEGTAETQAQQAAPQRLSITSSPPVSVHAGPFEFRMMSRRLEGQTVDHGGTLEVYGRVDGQTHELLKFDCFVHGPHWHRCAPGKPDVITQLDHHDAAQALQFALDTLRTRFAALLAEQGFATISAAATAPEVEAALAAVDGAMDRLIRRDPATLSPA